MNILFSVACSRLRWDVEIDELGLGRSLARIRLYMVHSVEALARRRERTEARQEQVLNAAAICFLAEGFNGASMSRIAAEAKMSVGHIYQYFENKEAIIIALCERRFSEFEQLLVDVERKHHENAASLAEAWISQFTWWLEPTRAPLTLEIMSEAGRNPKVAHVVAKIDRKFRDIMRGSLLPLAGPISNGEVEARLEAIVMLAHGMTSRMTADPAADPRNLLSALSLTVHKLLGREPRPAASDDEGPIRNSD
ncbi:TetR/AcrR family transcriptional regulator [Novosphingobium sp. M1R2S20]|uniref:TetR/AcrR family transcriptional regulator n=1 Tax=Novosphingobium rhizovicinum TaxID=3228928 RepID=A0ABV3RCB0_9SPHN